MSDRLEIVNRAMALLGAERLSSLEDATAPAQLVRDVYDLTLRAALSSYRWTFAREESAQLAPLVGATADGFQRYQLPADYLALTRVYVSSGAQDAAEVAFRLDGQVLVVLEDVPSTAGLYVGFVKAVGEGCLPPHVAKALSYELAAELAFPITENATLAELRREEAERLWTKARRVDFQSAGTRSLMDLSECSFLTARRG